MDVGTNDQGLRWLVDEDRQGTGFTARVWREDENADDDKPPRLAAARSGFSTREAAVEWASGASEADGVSEADERRGRIVLGLVGVICLSTLVLAVVRAFTAPTVFNIGGTREVTREIRVIRPGSSVRPSGGGGRARPVPR
jgi:hypothetical protein